MVVVPAAPPMDWLLQVYICICIHYIYMCIYLCIICIQARLLRQIGRGLSKLFASGKAVAAGVAGAVNGEVPFDALLGLLQDDNAQLADLRPAHVQQLCAAAGGRVGEGEGEGGEARAQKLGKNSAAAISVERVEELMREHDWRQDLRTVVADAAFDQGVVIQTLVNQRVPRHQRTVTRADFRSIVHALVGDTVAAADADALFDYCVNDAPREAGAEATPRYGPERLRVSMN